MTQDELTIYRLQVDLLVQRIALRALMKAVATIPTFEQFPSHLESLLTTRAQEVRFPQASQPGYSDLIAAEFQEAVQRFFDEL